MPNNPNGHYTDVHVYDIQHCGGTLKQVTGTYNAGNGTFSCGGFPQHDRPKVGCFYNIDGMNGGKRYQFSGWKCTNAGQTSDFKAS